MLLMTEKRLGVIVGQCARFRLDSDQSCFVASAVPKADLAILTKWPDAESQERKLGECILRGKAVRVTLLRVVESAEKSIP